MLQSRSPFGLMEYNIRSDRQIYFVFVQLMKDAKKHAQLKSRLKNSLLRE